MTIGSAFSRRVFLTAAGVASFFCLSGEAVPTRTSKKNRRLASAEIKSTIEAARENILGIMAANGVPGAAVTLVYGDETLWVEGFGVANPRTGLRVDEHTIFSVQSTSKNFTATAIMVAVQDGLLELDEPITTYIPDFSVNSRYEDAPQRKMTLRLLLSHRAGFTHEAPIGNNFDPESPGFEAHIHSISDTWLRYPVGERFSYSNLGIDLAGYILQQVSGVGFAAWLSARIFDPLGMTDTTVVQDDYVTRGNRAVGHAPGYEVVPVRIPLIPSGGVYTSAADMARYARFHLDEGRFRDTQILDRDLWKEMHSFPYGGGYSLGVVKDADLGFEKGSVRIFGHGGDGFGFSTIYNYCPQAQLAWAVLFNGTTLPGKDPHHAFRTAVPTKITERAFRRFGTRLPTSAAAHLTAPEMSPEILREHVGNYLGRGHTANMVLANGSLRLDWGSRVDPLSFISPDEAWITEGPLANTKLRYYPARGIEVPHVELENDGTQLDYNDGPDDAVGAIGTECDHLLGIYQIEVWGKPHKRMFLGRKNGYLYLDNFRLTRHIPDLFFTGSGEAADFRSTVPTFLNVRLKRQPPASDTDPAVTTLLQAVLQQIAAGALHRDTPALTPEFAGELFPDQVKKVGDFLRSLGPPSSFVLIERSERNEHRTLEYHAMFKGMNVRVLATLTVDGKISGLEIGRA
jgi:CubicO group peptidase (beta-lactamase class C family)